MPNPIQKLTLLYDSNCPLCVRCQLWIAAQPSFVEIECISTNSLTTHQRYSDVPWIGDELVIVADTGEVWAGSAAFLVALWALRDWRHWSFRLSGSMLGPWAERFFLQISKKRHWLGALLPHNDCTDEQCQLSQKKGPYR